MTTASHGSRLIRRTGIQCVERCVSPADFVPIAEESNQIQALRDLALRLACLRAREWRTRGVVPPEFAISVNISKVQLMMPDFPEHLNTVVRDTGIEPRDIKLEVTETTIVDNRARSTNSKSTSPSSSTKTRQRRSLPSPPRS